MILRDDEIDKNASVKFLKDKWKANLVESVDGGYYVFHIYENHNVRNVPVSLKYIRDVAEFLVTKIMPVGLSFEIPKEPPRKRDRYKK